MNHVIVEGPDGSGKSSLIRILLLSRVHTVAFKPEYGDPMAFYLSRVTERTEPTGFDRLWLSELIYGPMLRERSAITRQQAHLLKRTLAVPVVLCLPPFLKTLQNTRSRPFPAYQTDDFLWKAYHHFHDFANSDLVDFVYEYPSKNLRASHGVPQQLASLL